MLFQITFEPTTTHIKQAIRDGHTLYLCFPVEYELLRGLIKVNAVRQRQIFEEDFAPFLTPLRLTDADWRRAAPLSFKDFPSGVALIRNVFLTSCEKLRSKRSSCF